MSAEAFEWDGYCVRCQHGVSLSEDADEPDCEEDAICNTCLWDEVDALRKVAETAKKLMEATMRETKQWQGAMALHEAMNGLEATRRSSQQPCEEKR